MTDSRAIHLVGSMPSDDAEEAMRTALDRVGPRLRSLPDGETGDRRNWVVPMVLALAHHPDLEEARPGDWADYDHISRVKIRAGHRLTADALDFGHVAAFEKNFPLARQLAAEYGRGDLLYQVGLPGDLDMAAFSLGPAQGIRRRSVFAEMTLRDIRSIHARAGDQVVFQLEMPIELVLVSRAAPPLRPLLAALLARGVGRFARQAPRGARFGLHLCLGDLGNKAMRQLGDADSLVALANALVRRWPSGPSLDYIHVPFAAGDQPAPCDGPFYRPLEDLRLPPEVRFVAGFVHERRSDQELRTTLATIEERAGRRVDLAAACGLGRRTPAAALENLSKAAALVDA